MVMDNPGKGADIGRADGLAFIQDRRRACEQRAINDIAVP
jgi:hypothetical protein